MSFPQISDDPGIIFARFGVPAQPALVVIDARGTTKVLLGAMSDADLQAVLVQASAA